MDEHQYVVRFLHDNGAFTLAVGTWDQVSEWLHDLTDRGDVTVEIGLLVAADR